MSRTITPCSVSSASFAARASRAGRASANFWSTWSNVPDPAAPRRSVIAASSPSQAARTWTCSNVRLALSTASRAAWERAVASAASTCFFDVWTVLSMRVGDIPANSKLFDRCGFLRPA